LSWTNFLTETWCLQQASSRFRIMAVPFAPAARSVSFLIFPPPPFAF
jgi:hypothetical protein